MDGAGLGGESRSVTSFQSSVLLRHLSGQLGTLSWFPGEVSCGDSEIFCKFLFRGGQSLVPEGCAEADNDALGHPKTSLWASVEGDVQHPEGSLCLENEAKVKAIAERGALCGTDRGESGHYCLIAGCNQILKPGLTYQSEDNSA